MSRGELEYKPGNGSPCTAELTPAKSIPANYYCLVGLMAVGLAVAHMPAGLILRVPRALPFHQSPHVYSHVRACVCVTRLYV